MNGKIKAKNSAWHFGKNIPKKFDKHIKKSVPQYESMQELISNLSDFFLKKNSICYDLGSSTGSLINKISNRHRDKKIQFYGIEIEKKMIEQAKKIKDKSLNKIKYLNKDLKKIKLQKTDMIISCYTIQFIEPKFRQDIINKIYKSLNWGGAFIMFEKIRASDPRFQDIFSQVYLDFKLKNKFSEKEIINKSRSLKGILEPFSEYGNLGLLKRAGFVDIIPVMQWVNFKGLLCIK
jgi:tRNA (cmo5U34)-methyltransferase